jgi:hypothetical protein
MKRFLPLLFLSGCLFTADRIEPTGAAALDARSSDAFFQLFQQAYETRSVGTLATLLAPDYEFQADPASVSDPSMATWGRDVELVRHQRMFQAIGDVNLILLHDLAQPTEVPAESTWHVSELRMTLSIQDTLYEVLGQADFTIRVDSTGIYRLVRWTDRN